MPFTALVRRVRSEDPEAQQELLERYGDALRREIRFTLLDARLRQFIGESDIYQSVVCRFYAGMTNGGFVVESPADLLALLKGIARTRIAELVRYWHAQKRDLNRNVALNVTSTRDTTAIVPSPLDIMERHELLASINGRLPDRDRKILNWRVEGLRVRSIVQADRCGESRAASWACG